MEIIHFFSFWILLQGLKRVSLNTVIEMGWHYTWLQSYTVTLNIMTRWPEKEGTDSFLSSSLLRSLPPKVPSKPLLSPGGSNYEQRHSACITTALSSSLVKSIKWALLIKLFRGMDLMREKVHKVILENQSSAIRGLKAICQYLISWFMHNTLKTKRKKRKQGNQAKQASEKERHLAISV